MSRQAKSNPDDRVLIPATQIARRVSEMAEQISTDYTGTELIAVIVLRGSFIFASDLLRQLDPTLTVRLDFIVASSYGEGAVSSGEVRIVKDLDFPVTGKNVLIIEDIVETGRTVETVRDRLKEQGATSVRVATILHKEGKLKSGLNLDYVGFPIPDVFVVGYGLDLGQLYRNLPDIQILDK